jgi:hypothetical protein
MFGILNLVWAALMGGGALLGLRIFEPIPAAPTGNTILDVYATSPGLVAFSQVRVIAQLLAALLVLAAGTGLLALREWGRRLSVVWAIYAIVAELIRAVFTVLVLLPANLDAFKESAISGQTMSEWIADDVTAQITFLTYPIVLLLFAARAPRAQRWTDALVRPSA